MPLFYPQKAVVKGGNRGCKIWLNGADLSRNDHLIYIELLNGRHVSAPIWLFEELAGFSDEELDDVEVIEAGRGILVGDREAVTVARVLGLDATNPETHTF